MDPNDFSFHGYMVNCYQFSCESWMYWSYFFVWL